MSKAYVAAEFAIASVDRTVPRQAAGYGSFGFGLNRSSTATHTLLDAVPVFRPLARHSTPATTVWRSRAVENVR